MGSLFLLNADFYFTTSLKVPPPPHTQTLKKTHTNTHTNTHTHTHLLTQWFLKGFTKTERIDFKEWFLTMRIMIKTMLIITVTITTISVSNSNIDRNNSNNKNKRKDKIITEKCFWSSLNDLTLLWFCYYYLYFKSVQCS